MRWSSGFLRKRSYALIPDVLKVEDVDMPSKGHLYAILKRIGNVSLA
jgi:hypothetical protein